MNPTITRRFRFPVHASVLSDVAPHTVWSPQPLPSHASPRLPVTTATGGDRPFVSIIRARGNC